MSTSTGKQAENKAAEYLRKKGYQVVAQNWRTRLCEIDIIAKKDETVFFVEVKYRLNDAHGSGLEYITKTKLKQMQFAAELWVGEHQWNSNYRLAAIEVTGEEFRITNFVEAL